MMPAKVRCISSDSGILRSFTLGKVYDAFFVEYWEGVRHSLHVRDDSGEIKDFRPFEEFEVLSDPDGLLEMKKAIVCCVTQRFEEYWFGVHFDREYVAVGRDRDGNYLVEDESGCCYFYPPTDFEIISDPDDILARRSIYYNYHGGPDMSLFE